jgi:hypothetical protein
MVLPETGLKVGYVWRIWSEFRWLARTRLLATTAMPHRRGSGLAGYLPVGFPGRLVPYPVHEWRPITLPDVLFHDREGFTVRPACRSFVIMKYLVPAAYPAITPATAGPYTALQVPS